MAREISITSKADKTDSILQELQAIEHLLELQVYRGVSVNPPGDVIKLAVPNFKLSEVMQLLDRFGLGEENGISICTSDPDGIIPTHSHNAIGRDNNEAAWEEMALTIGDDSNTSLNTLLIMFLSGSLAAIGIATNALHIVIGGMLIAPGFMPITRVALGLVARSTTWRAGALDFITAYAALMVGAVATAVALKVLGYDPLAATSSYYATENDLARYWSTISATSVMASCAASVAGGLLVVTKRSVLTSGVMIGLALVPSAALTGIGLLEADFELAKNAFIRFLVDAALVFACSWAVLQWKRLYVHKRSMRL